MKVASTMTVPEMRDLLGIKKTDSYWLIKKNEFETIIYNGQMRVDKASFEEWYAHQDHYHKVVGEKPGEKLHMETYTVRDVAEIVGISKDCVRDFIKKQGIPYWLDKQKFRIDKASFDEWISHQVHYRTKEQRERDAPVRESTLSIPEIGRMLGLDRRAAYKLGNQHRKEFETVIVGDKKRITIESFERWYQSQTVYVKLTAKELAVRNKLALLAKGKSSFNPKEAAELLEIDEDRLYQLIRTGKIRSIQIGRRIRIENDELQDYLRQEEEET